MSVLLDHRMLIIDVVIHTRGLQTTVAKKQLNLTRLDLRLQVKMKYIYCHKCIRSENLQLYMEEMHWCTYRKCYLYL